MTDRVRTSMEGSSACPFIAYEDERDERSAEPDHAHRCYAEVRPAPRALAHQEAYCLSSAFPVCPTFQAWARREAAQARTTAAAASAAAAAASATAAASAAAPDPVPGPEAPSALQSAGDGVADPDLDAGDDASVQRNPPRDWAAPPPWAMGAAGASAARAGSTGGAPDFLASRSSEGQGLAGSAADRLAGGASIADVTGPPVAIPSSAPSAPADPDLADLVGGPTWRAGSATEPREPLPPPRPAKRPPVSSTRDRNVDRTPVQEGPSWERARRYEAYPTIKTRTGMPGIPRILLLAGALGFAALALFFLPALLGVGGKDKGGSSPSASASLAAETASPSATAQAAPTAQVYVVKTGDTFTRIAKKNNVTVEQLKAANPGIKDINKIAVGDEIVIPVPPPDVVTEPSVAPSASP